MSATTSPTASMTDDNEHQVQIPFGLFVFIIAALCIVCQTWRLTKEMYERQQQRQEQQQQQQQRSRISNQHDHHQQQQIQVQLQQYYYNQHQQRLRLNRVNTSTTNRSTGTETFLSKAEFIELLLHNIYHKQPSAKIRTDEQMIVTNDSTTTATTSTQNEQIVQRTDCDDETNTKIVDVDNRGSGSMEQKNCNNNTNSTHNSGILYDTTANHGMYQQECRTESSDPSIDPEESLVTVVVPTTNANRKIDESSVVKNQSNDESNNSSTTDVVTNDKLYWTTVDICGICLDEIEDKDCISVLPKCHHMFHTKCIQEWLLQIQSIHCPLCKTAVK